MHVAIFGANGPTGRLLLAQLTSDRHSQVILAAGTAGT